MKSIFKRDKKGLVTVTIQGMTQGEALALCHALANYQTPVGEDVRGSVQYAVQQANHPNFKNQDQELFDALKVEVAAKVDEDLLLGRRAVAVSGNVKVVLEYHGEGDNGDYDPNDPEDAPLIRFSVYRHYEQGEAMDGFFLDDPTPIGEYGADETGWRPVSGGSYCTEIDARSPDAVLDKAAHHILDTIKDDIANQVRCKRKMEQLSHLHNNDLH